MLDVLLTWKTQRLFEEKKNACVYHLELGVLAHRGDFHEQKEGLR